MSNEYQWCGLRILPRRIVLAYFGGQLFPCVWYQPWCQEAYCKPLLLEWLRRLSVSIQLFHIEPLGFMPFHFPPTYCFSGVCYKIPAWLIGSSIHFYSLGQVFYGTMCANSLGHWLFHSFGGRSHCDGGRGSPAWRLSLAGSKEHGTAESADLKDSMAFLV